MKNFKINDAFFYTLYLGIFLIFLLFNPFTVPGLYMDSTFSFSFIASFKIILLNLLNLFLLILWIIRIKTQSEFKLIASNVYISLFLFVISILLSHFIFAENKHLSFWGSTFTLENSFVESINLIIFFIILLNNLEITNISNFINTVLLATAINNLYLIIRFTSLWQIDNDILEYYFNSNYFSLTGNHSSNLIVTFISVLLGIGILLDSIDNKINLKKDEDKNNNNNLFKIIFIYLPLLINSISLGMLLNLASPNKNLYYIFFIITLSIVLVYYLASKNILKFDIKNPHFKVIVLTFLSILLGIIINFFISPGQPKSYVNLDLQTSWNVTLNSLKDSFLQGMFGNGFGSFEHNFDKYKSEFLALPINDNENRPLYTRFTINSRLPQIEEIKVYQYPSTIMGILLNQGILGVLSILLIIGLLIFSFIQKKDVQKNIFPFSLLLSLIFIVFAFVFTGYEFIVLLYFWILVALLTFVINYNNQKNLIISLDSRFGFANNFSFIIPLVLAIFVGVMLFGISKIIYSNYLLFEARKNLKNSNLEEYKNLVLESFKVFPESTIIGHEYNFSVSIDLSKKIADLSKKIKDFESKKSDSKDKINLTEEENRDIQNQLNEILTLSNIIFNNLNYLKILNSSDYRIYFFEGLINTILSEITNFSKDQNALISFTNALNFNPYHPESHYNRAKILLRNSANDKNNLIIARNEILTALKYRPNNIVYNLINADIQTQLGTILKKENSFEESKLYLTNALNIYKDFENNKSKNNLIEEIYNSEKIEERIKKINQLLEEIKSSVTEDTQSSKNQIKNENNITKPTSSPKPTSSITPTPTKKINN